MWTTRLKEVELTSYVERLLKEIEFDGLSIFDPDIGGGQFVSVAEKMIGCERVSGLCENEMDINYAKAKLGLNGKYTVGKFLETGIVNMKNKIVVGNPPYNDGLKARNPIYDKFLAKLTQNLPDKVVFIIPTNWFSQDKTKLGKDVREHLKSLGIYKIVLNPVDLFKGVTVGTCTVFCEKDYTGEIILFNDTQTNSVVLDNFDEQILTEFDTVSLTLLKRLKPFTPYTTHSGNKKDTQKWRITTSYRKERFDIDPLNPLKVMEPEYKSQGGYRVFDSFDTKDEADEYLEYYKSFWHSKLVKFIMRRTRTSTTLDNPQLRWVPNIESFDKVYSDRDLYKMFKLSEEEIEVVENDNK